MSKPIALFPRKAQMKFLRQVMSASSLEAACELIQSKADEFEPSDHIGWHEAFHMLASGLANGKPRFAIVSREGNKKLPFAAFSAVPVLGCPGAGACALFCYSLKAWQYPSAYCRQLQNSLLLRFNPAAIERSFLALPEGTTFRLYVDGDFDSQATIQFWFGLLARRPDIVAYGYSKSWDLLAAAGPFPANYWLNLSSGGRHQGATPESFASNPQVRGQFIAVPIDYHGERGFKRYADPAYHKAVRSAAIAQGIQKPFSCPGQCGTCTSRGPACGIETFRGKPIVIGIH